RSGGSERQAIRGSSLSRSRSSVEGSVAGGRPVPALPGNCPSGPATRQALADLFRRASVPPASELQPAQAALTLRGANLSGRPSSPEPPMSSPGSVTVWIAELREGDSRAAQRLWEGYFRRLVELARHKLLGRPRAAADEEDVALSAFDS